MLGFIAIAIAWPAVALAATAPHLVSTSLMVCVSRARARAALTRGAVLLADDYGWANVGYHRSDTSKEVATPNIDALAAAGVKLERFYTYKICSPSRCALQTGRLPVHVNTVNLAPETHNPKDRVAGFAGIPPNMTTLAWRLKQAGYRTVMTGKWDAGMALQKQTPRGRGFDHFLGYFHHANDYFTQGIPLTAVGEIDVCFNAFKDLWKDDGPAVHLAGTGYEEDLFANHTLGHIAAHDASTPLFLLHSFHLIHTPLQVKPETLDLFSFIDYPNRRSYAAMVWYMDTIIGAIVDALKRKAMWDNALVLFMSDNGGPVYNPGSASNFPHRGGKYSDFEGGVRVNSFLAGGKIPAQRRGKAVDQLVHIADVYSTFIGLAHGGSPDNLAALVKDDEAERAGLPPVDSNDFWPFVTGASAGKAWKPRTEIHLSPQALLSGQFKLIVGVQPMSLWVGPSYPNATGAQPVFPDVDRERKFDYDCGPAGCLFNVFDDPAEHKDVAADLPELRQLMLQRLNELNQREFKPDRGQPDRKVCRAALLKWKGFYGALVVVCFG